MNNTLFRPSVIKANRKKFNPEGFDLAKAIQAKKTDVYLPLPPRTQLSESHIKAFADCQPVELIDYTSTEEQQLVIRAAYRQVFGNAHVMESERILEAESQLCSGAITVMEFIRQLAKSERYRTLFFDNCTNLRAIELNFKHLLGRAPENYAEISEHIKILAEGGLAAEIDSYLDSDEYLQNFGTNIVPYYRGYETQTGKSLAGFTHSFQLLRGASSSDKSISGHGAPQLQEALLEDKPTPINPLSTVPTLVSRILPLAIPEQTFKDVDLSPAKYKSSEFLATPISPNTWLQKYKAREAAATFPAARESQPVKLYPGASVEELEIVIRAAYKQVFGNVHLMESQKLLTSESKLKSGQITIKEFIRELAKSDLYRSLFFDDCSNIRAIELNFKHLLGRAPDSYQEISEHLAILLEGGFEAEIDSYFESQEYQDNFGEDTIPYYVSYSTQTGKSVAGYNRIFQLIKGSSSSDRSIADSIGASKVSQLQESLLQKLEIEEPPVFNPQGFDLARSESIEIELEEDYRIPSVSDPYTKGFADVKPIEFIPGDSSAENQNLVIEAAYKQVFGNAHLMESERLPQIESQFRNDQITVIEFIRQLAKSELYRALFFENYTNLRAIELNFKHFLGRAPENYAEISEHIKILAEQGFEAEIDSYLDSDEYFQSFGANIVPYYRGYKTQKGKNLAGFTHSFQLLRGASSSDKSNAKVNYLELDKTLLTNQSNQIRAIDDIPHVEEKTREAIELERQAKISQTIVSSASPTYNGSSLTQRAITCKNEYQNIANGGAIKLIPGSSPEEIELVIKALYKQVLGNAYVMESERLIVPESQLKQGEITVREFVRLLAKSELYKSRFIDNCPRYRSHELNFKHLLGRAPDSYQETIHHSNILDSQGYEADIDSYVDSEEYQEAFGNNTVPYYRGYQTQTGHSLLGYTNMFEMLESLSTSDKAGFRGNQSRLQEQLMSKNPTVIPAITVSQPVTDTVKLIQQVLNIRY